ncbi:ATP-dependent nuclease, subunit B [Leuconostoc kimchii IMSNU 11154]|uniref:ATP-dependent helicase/deoxyribonuclease subunit B n=1 Tax=Leuconostoc kimchii (strain IMSNU 11154 / KCTC 2386 / IH25) TaxID=762051 RepID=D5T5I7_LEUKI|nr:PD-(D/E)XK nuclease family protein [Leuconostoc kimchii]ADG41317.1 ATP-dependent nuclease, subunit B [Leuconostoc kimchii IMSNU 11154]
MGLKIFMNNARTDLRASLLEDVQKNLQQTPNLTVYYIVPNHVKFDSEVDVLKQFAILNGKTSKNKFYAQSRLQVYSLTRLAWALLKDMPDAQPNIIQNTGLFIMVSDILREYAAQLPVFARMQSKSGFISALVKQLVELRASHISPQDLLQILNDESHDDTFLRQTLASKLRDLAIVSDALTRKIGTERITQQEVLPFFATQLAATQLENVAFYFDNFNGFTSAEMQVVSQILTHYPTTIALLGDVKKLGYQQAGDVFNKPMQTAQQLVYLTKQANQSVELIAATKPRQLSHTVNQVLSAWENLGEYRAFSGEVDKVELQAFAAENTVVEMQEIARRVRRLLVEQPTLRLRDILILARDLTPYTAHIPEVMSQFDLPYFLDTDQKMVNHPLVELILNLLVPAKDRFQYQNVMTVLKTSLLRPYNQTSLVPEDEFFDVVSYFDNYLYANRPYEKTWRNLEKPFELFTVVGQIDDDDATIVSDDAITNRRIETLRRFVLTAFDALQVALDQAKTTQLAATNLVTWLQNFHVVDAITEQRDALILAGELTRSRQGEEVWQLLTQTLDEIVEISGNEPFDLSAFKDVLSTGFSGAKFSGIPNNLDQLTISEAGIVQNNHYKQLFFIGGTRSNLPAQAKTTALINDAERLIVQPALKEAGVSKYLQNTAQQQMTEENLLFYGALAATTDNLTLSYPMLEASGKISEMSPFFKRLIATFNVSVEKVASKPHNGADLLKRYIGTARATLSELVKILPTQRTTAAFKAIQNTIADTQSDRLTRVLSAPNYKNTSQVLKPEFVHALFGDQLNVSISQLESYYRNPLGYFIQYGLKLKERATNELDVAQTGTLYHAVLEGVLKALIKENMSLRDITTPDLLILVQQKMTEIIQSPEYQLLQENGKMRATRDYLQRVSATLLMNLQRSARVNSAKPSHVEQLFGFPSQASLPPLKFSRGKVNVQVRGKIDRFDIQDQAHVFGTIIDYKSSGKQFDWGQAFDGLQMQLLTYWQAAQMNAQLLGVEAIGGAFFAQIAPEKQLIANFKGDIDDLLAGNVKPDIFKYRGLFVSEEDYIDSLDHSDDSRASQFYQLKRKNDGALYANSDFVDPEDFELLLSRNRDNINRAGEHILAGLFPLEPTIASLRYTSFADILRFDRSLGDTYRPEAPKGKANILKILRERDDHGDTIYD